MDPSVAAALLSRRTLAKAPVAAPEPAPVADPAPVLLEVVAEASEPAEAPPAPVPDAARELRILAGGEDADALRPGNQGSQRDEGGRFLPAERPNRDDVTEWPEEPARGNSSDYLMRRLQRLAMGKKDTDEAAPEPDESNRDDITVSSDEPEEIKGVHHTIDSAAPPPDPFARARQLMELARQRARQPREVKGKASSPDAENVPDLAQLGKGRKTSDLALAADRATEALALLADLHLVEQPDAEIETRRLYRKMSHALHQAREGLERMQALAAADEGGS